MARSRSSRTDTQHEPVPMVRIEPTTSNPSGAPAEPIPPRGSSHNAAGASRNSSPNPPSFNASTLNPLRALANRPRASSIRIKRQPSSNQISYFQTPSTGDLITPSASGATPTFDGIEEETTGRRRSSSEPQRPSWLGTPDDLTRSSTVVSGLPNISETHAEDHTDRSGQRLSVPEPEAAKPTTRAGRLRAATTNSANRGLQRLSSFTTLPGSRSSQLGSETPERSSRANEYESEIVDLLDVVDPEVSTLSTLTNVQNSLFIPDLGRFLNRRPTYELTPRASQRHVPTDAEKSTTASMAPSGTSSTPSVPSEPRPPIPPKEPRQPRLPPMAERPSEETERPHFPRNISISSDMSDTRYAVLPHGVTLLGWSEDDKELLNDHVRHMLHSKRSAFKRGMKGFWKYIQKPLGFFVTLYAILITLFGLAWVLFLIGWINVGGRQLYVINVIDNVLVALFAIMGDGLAPFRCVDTYHMIFIAHYHYLSWQRRRERRLPDLKDHNDLPSEIPNNVDMEVGATEKADFSVLTPKQQANLEHHSRKYAKSHTFYRPHETETHYAFPVKLLITVTVLLDFHSIFQICLGSVTWSINYHHRPAAATATILCCSISCNIAAGIVITIGDRITRKKEIIELQFRQALTRSAIKKVQKEKRREAEAHGEDPEIIPVPETHAVVTQDTADNESVLDDAHNRVTVVGSPEAVDKVVDRIRSPEKYDQAVAEHNEHGEHQSRFGLAKLAETVAHKFPGRKRKGSESLQSGEPYPGT